MKTHTNSSLSKNIPLTILPRLHKKACDYDGRSEAGEHGYDVFAHQFLRFYTADRGDRDDRPWNERTAVYPNGNDLAEGGEHFLVDGQRLRKGGRCRANDGQPGESGTVKPGDKASERLRDHHGYARNRHVLREVEADIIHDARIAAKNGLRTIRPAEEEEARDEDDRREDIDAEAEARL